MTKIWYNDIYVLLEKPYQFFPSNTLTGLEKINALARLAIYYAIIILTFVYLLHFPIYPLLYSPHYPTIG